jgi:hypothetical protein
LKSSIPPGIVEKPLHECRHEGTLRSDRVTECLLNGVRVGQRVYNQQGVMVLESPMKGVLKHGWEFTWDEDGKLLLVEPYVNGEIHGTAKQYGQQGHVIGTYTLIHGTGFDVWRQENKDQTVFVSEIHSLKDGVPHGYEWHLASSQGDLWYERAWYMGKLHGIERSWNSRGGLRRGCPRFYILDQTVSRQKYLKLARSNQALPAYREEEDLPYRVFPPEIRGLMSS